MGHQANEWINYQSNLWVKIFSQFDFKIKKKKGWFWWVKKKNKHKLIYFLGQPAGGSGGGDCQIQTSFSDIKGGEGADVASLLS